MINYLGNMKRELHHVKLAGYDDEYEPTMVLFFEGRFGRSAMIPLSAAYKYDEPKTQEEKEAVLQHCMGIARHLGLEMRPETYAQLAMLIADGLDGLIAMPPYEERRVTIGEMTLFQEGRQVSRDVEVTESEAVMPMLEVV